MSHRLALTLVLSTLVLAWSADASAARRRKKPVDVPPERVVAPTPPAPEQAQEPTFERATALYDEGQFLASLDMLEALQKKTPTASIKFYFALNFLALGNEARAKEALKSTLDLNPDFALPTFVSPQVRSMFERVKATHKVIPIIEHVPPAEIEAKQGADLMANIARMRPQYAARLHFRAQGETAYRTVDFVLKIANEYHARIPAALLLKEKPYTLEYYVGINEERVQTPIAQLRSDVAPFSVPVTVPSEVGPVYKRWWFWTIIGAVVVGGAAAATTVVLLNNQKTGDVDVRLRF